MGAAFLGAAFLAAGFLATVFLATGFLAAAFLGAAFLAATFFGAAFLAAGVAAFFLATVFFATVFFFAAAFLDFNAMFSPSKRVPRRFRAGETANLQTLKKKPRTILMLRIGMRPNFNACLHERVIYHKNSGISKKAAGPP
ncbi:MAG: hypothetical protein ACPG1C_05805 [Alphaproteobacteria bacterium]